MTVSTGGYPKGYLNAWIDFNRDGDWSDSGEQIATGLRLGAGTHVISFDVPVGVTVGNSFARFRYALERNLGPGGAASAGEVEDHAILLLKNEPVANPDNFEVPQDAINVSLDVLDNDFPSSTGVLTIIAVTQPTDGTVVIAPGGQSLLYSPARGVFSPPTQVFSYTIGDGTGKTDSANVTVFVQPALVEPLAIDDTYRVAAGSGGNNLRVLQNDLTGVLGTMQLISGDGSRFGHGHHQQQWHTRSAGRLHCLHTERFVCSFGPVPVHGQQRQRIEHCHGDGARNTRSR